MQRLEGQQYPKILSSPQYEELDEILIGNELRQLLCFHEKVFDIQTRSLRW